LTYKIKDKVWESVVTGACSLNNLQAWLTLKSTKLTTTKIKYISLINKIVGDCTLRVSVRQKEITIALSVSVDNRKKIQVILNTCITATLVVLPELELLNLIKITFKV
jgi:hypothetical protein